MRATAATRAQGEAMAEETQTRDSDQLRSRLRRVEGQIQGVQRMLAEGRTCEDVLTQLLAIRAAVEQISLRMTERHMRECIMPDLAPDDPRIAATLDVLKLWARTGG